MHIESHIKLFYTSLIYLLIPMMLLPFTVLRFLYQCALDAWKGRGRPGADRRDHDGPRRRRRPEEEGVEDPLEMSEL